MVATPVRGRRLLASLALFLVLIFIVVPIAELYVIIQVGEAIGVCRRWRS